MSTVFHSTDLVTWWLVSVFQGLWRWAVWLPGTEGVSERGRGHSVHQANPRGGQLPPRQENSPLWSQGLSRQTTCTVVDIVTFLSHTEVTESHWNKLWPHELIQLSCDILSKQQKLVSCSKFITQNDSALLVRPRYTVDYYQILNYKGTIYVVLIAKQKRDRNIRHHFLYFCLLIAHLFNDV